MDKINIKSTPKDVFLHLLNIITFYISIVGFITLYFQYINVLFPDPLNFYYSGITGAIRWATSVLMIAVPSFLLTSWMLAKDIINEPQKRELKLRKWLVYFTLFIAALTIIIDLITLVYNFLGGELTGPFFLKILVVLFVAGSVFSYFIWDLKRKEIKSKVPKILAWVLFVFVFASIVVGFFIVGTPADQRSKRFDEQRVEDLRIIQGEIVVFWKQKERLPENLDELKDSISGFVAPVDPETEQSYEYTIKDDLSFDLCATFKTSSKDLVFGSREIKSPYYDKFEQNWEHEAGRTCFERTIDPEIYKDGEGVIPKPILREFY